MVIEMCRYRLSCHIICRVLYRCKCINVMSDWKNYNSSWMLSGCSSDSRTAFRNSCYFTSSLLNSTLFTIFSNICFSGFLGNCTDCSCSESLSLTKDNFRIFMCLTLIFTGEIKVNIRLFITLET